MTPAQEAKEYAAVHGFSIETDGRRYRILYGDNSFATVSGYPAVLNAMKRYVQEQAVSAALEQARATGKVGAIVGDVNATKVEILSDEQIAQNMIVGAQIAGCASRESAVELCKALTPSTAHRLFDKPVADFPFEDDASKARIRAEARRIHKPAEGTPEWYARRPWRIVCGPTAWPMAYASRSDALKTVRQRFAGLTAIRIIYMGA